MNGISCRTYDGEYKENEREKKIAHIPAAWESMSHHVTRLSIVERQCIPRNWLYDGSERKRWNCVSGTKQEADWERHNSQAHTDGTEERGRHPRPKWTLWSGGKVAEPTCIKMAKLMRSLATHDSEVKKVVRKRYN